MLLGAMFVTTGNFFITIWYKVEIVSKEWYFFGIIAIFIGYFDWIELIDSFDQ